MHYGHVLANETYNATQNRENAPPNGHGGDVDHPPRVGHGQPPQSGMVSTEEGPAWDAPDAAFESYVADLVKRRLGKYCQPDHPTRISHADANMLYAKIKKQVVDKERDAYAQRQAAGTYKPILKDKLEVKIRDFVRESIKRRFDMAKM